MCPLWPGSEEVLQPTLDWSEILFHLRPAARAAAEAAAERADARKLGDLLRAQPAPKLGNADFFNHQIMQRIAVPMIGGMISSTLLTLIVIPAIFGLVRGYVLPAVSTGSR